MRQPIGEPYCYGWQVYANLPAGSGDRRFEFLTLFGAPSPVAAEGRDQSTLPDRVIRSARSAITDMDGDGYPDFVRVDSTGPDHPGPAWVVYRFTGTEIEDGVFWPFETTGAYPRVTVDIDHSSNPEDFYSVTWGDLHDVTGDGLPDIYRFDWTTGDLRVYYNHGSGFTEPRIVGVQSGAAALEGLTSALMDVAPGTSNVERQDRLFAIDRDADGRGEISAQYGYYFNLGDGFLGVRSLCGGTISCPGAGLPVSWITQSTWRHRYQPIDLDGTGIRNWVLETTVNDEDIAAVELHGGTALPGRLTKIDNGRGLTTAIKYSPLGTPEVVSMGDGTHPRPRWVVKSMTSTHEFGAAPSSTATYFYDTPVRTADRPHRGEKRQPLRLLGRLERPSGLLPRLPGRIHLAVDHR
jgi:hypothetical protein